MGNQVLAALERMQVRDADAWMVATPALRDQLAVQITHFPAFALPAPDRAVCIAGISHLNGVGEVWMVTGAGFEGMARRVLRQARLLLPCLYDALGLHRLHMTVESGRRDAARWAIAAGFRFEAGPLRGMGAQGQDMDFYLYERKVAA